MTAEGSAAQEASSSNIHVQMGHLDIKDNAAYNWKMFKQRFQIYLKANGKDKNSDDIKVAILLSMVGEEALNLFNTFGIDYETAKLVEVLDAFEKQLNPKTNVVYEGYKFMKRCQKPGEPFDTFLFDLKQLGKSCEYGDQTDILVQDLIILGIADAATQEKLLSEGNTELDDVIKVCRAAEKAKEQSQQIRGESASVCALRGQKSKREHQNRKRMEEGKGSSKFNCRRCGVHHEKGNCPAFNKLCRICNQRGHFYVGCSANRRNRWVNETIEETEDEEEKQVVLDSINSKTVNNVYNSNDKTYNNVRCETTANGNSIITFKLDPGADCNILPLMHLIGIEEHISDKIAKTETVIVTYGDRKLSPIGCVVLKCLIKDQHFNVRFIVLNVKGSPLLGFNTCIKTNLLKRVNAIGKQLINSDDKEKANFIYSNVDISEGLGTVPFKYKIQLKDKAQPIINPCRRVPETIKCRLKETLDQLEKDKIIV